MSDAEKIEKQQSIKGYAGLKDAVADVQKVLADDVATAYDNAENPDVYKHLKHIEDNFGHHAYRYETLDDGSVVAIWGRPNEDKIKFKAFPDIETASLWSPRVEFAKE